MCLCQKGEVNNTSLSKFICLSLTATRTDLHKTKSVKVADILFIYNMCVCVYIHTHNVCMYVKSAIIY